MPFPQANHVSSMLSINALHASSVGVGFIPTLLTADEIKSKCTAAARVGINPTPTMDHGGNG